MEQDEYPKFTSEAELLPLTPRQHVLLHVEGNPMLSATTVLWFLGVCCSFTSSHVPVEARSVLLTATIIFFTTSVFLFWLVYRNGGLEKDRHNHERAYLKRMGVKKPKKFLKEHPLHLAAYKDLMKGIHESRYTLYSSEGFRRKHAAAMLVFTGKERYKSGPLILSLMDERGINDAAEIAGLLDTVDDAPPVLNDGAL